ncbi:MAG: hypothetical protein COU29_00075 [Candidatus Magasanikbacteria bacterium CG10_big_fil_rev_8_21_14_0_10_36_32]|uniref:Glycosyltransferase 2-like domain-containing protein n=1 Tax=Candidatus Magasanikbacteria bacterium CG10_big_fil_rev_8_21_14_0_10_36_32 TaxID=1974646 RepID=A0A2M6W7Q2_9BACT|nr:MAG: hypothetical protein COU29_00075 [Candidatus Magasanikbacteria bacterium CG10_big_fil_rev_8_21_14_0_10_36_32]
MNNKLISIIIPVYNHAHTLKRSLDCVFRQTYRPLEVVIVNDGSTDNFGPTIRTIMMTRLSKTVNIKIINQENRGAPSAKNIGFTQSHGDYVIFWDADTIAEPVMLEKMVGVLEKNPSASYVYCDYKFGWKKMPGQRFDPTQLKLFNYIDTTSLLRREDFVLFDEQLKKFQDWDMWLTLLSKGKVGVWLPEMLYKKIVAGRDGISSWLPSFFYKLPWKTKAVKKYEEARRKIVSKHHLMPL